MKERIEKGVDNKRLEIGPRIEQEITHYTHLFISN